MRASSIVEVDEDRFRIEVERTGGFAGLRQHGSLDSSELEPNESRELAALLDGLELDAIAAAASGRAGVDRFQYRVVVERGGERIELVLGETEVPDELRPLLDRALSRP